MKQRREGAYLCRYLRLNEKRNPFLADSFLAVRTVLVRLFYAIINKFKPFRKAPIFQAVTVFVEYGRTHKIKPRSGTFPGTRFLGFRRLFPFIIFGESIKLRHIFSLYCVHDFYIRLHSLVIAVPRPFHNNSRGNTQPYSIAYKRPSSAMGSQ